MTTKNDITKIVSKKLIKVVQIQKKTQKLISIDLFRYIHAKRLERQA